METQYAPHKLASIFPRMAADDLRDLEEDIKKNGLVQPIVLLDDEVLDGVHRQQACVKNGIEPHYETFEQMKRRTKFGGSPLDFIMSQNLKRRQLTASQRATVATDALPYFEAEAKKRQLGSLKRGENLPSAPNGANGEPEGKAAEQAAKTTGASTRQVERAKALKAKSPAKFEKVKKGELTLSKAEQDKAKSEAKKQLLETAYGRIEKICGKPLADAARRKIRLKNPKDVLAFASMDVEEMRKVAGLIEVGPWTLKQARLFKAKNLTASHPIRYLFYKTAQNRGKWMVDIDGWRITVIRTKHAMK